MTSKHIARPRRHPTIDHLDVVIRDVHGAAVREGRRHAAAFVRERPCSAESDLGLGWAGTEAAPATYQQLRGAFATSLATGQPLPVLSLHCDPPPYGDAEDTMALRFWHDVHHVQLGLSFSMPEELELATWQLGQTRHAGIEEDSLAYRLLEADFLGQVLLMGIAQRFPLNQEAFVFTCAEAGLRLGLLAELCRVS